LGAEYRHGWIPVRRKDRTYRPARAGVGDGLLWWGGAPKKMGARAPSGKAEASGQSGDHSLGTDYWLVRADVPHFPASVAAQLIPGDSSSTGRFSGVKRDVRSVLSIQQAPQPIEQCGIVSVGPQAGHEI
jgi:hypothetical protein